MSKKPRTAEEARILIRSIIRELPAAQRGRLIYSCGIPDKDSTKEVAIEFFSELAKPRTADEAVAHFQSVYDSLPQDERDRLSFLMVAIGGNVEPIDFFAGVLRFVMDLPEEFRHLLLATAIEAMTPTERRRWIRYCERSDVFGESESGDIILLSLCNIAESCNRDAQKDRAFREALQSFSPAVLARIKTVGNRIEAIDSLLNEGSNRLEIYEQMHLKHEPLMKGREQDFMDENSMWDSYKACGGCHPKAQQPRGRPKKNGS